MLEKWFRIWTSMIGLYVLLIPLGALVVWTWDWPWAVILEVVAWILLMLAVLFASAWLMYFWQALRGGYEEQRVPVKQNRPVVQRVAPTRFRLKTEPKPLTAEAVKMAANICFGALCGLYWLVLVTVFAEESWPKEDVAAWSAWAVMFFVIPLAVWGAGACAFRLADFMRRKM